MVQRITFDNAALQQENGLLSSYCQTMPAFCSERTEIEKMYSADFTLRHILLIAPYLFVISVGRRTTQNDKNCFFHQATSYRLGELRELGIIKLNLLTL